MGEEPKQMGLIIDSALKFDIEFLGICVFLIINSKIILKCIFRKQILNSS